MGDSVKSIGESAFLRCTSLQEITIPYGITSIEASAFRGCSGLTSVTIPESVTTIGNEAFSSCTGLNNIIIPESIKSIGYSAFSGCSNIKYISIPGSLETISRSTFEDCSSLTSLLIPLGVTTIGQTAFKGCSSLKSVSIPSSVTYVFSSTQTEYCAFYGCNNIDSIFWDSNCNISYITMFCKGSLKNISLGENVTVIGDNAFYNCSKISKLSITDNITKIGQRSFGYCTGLTSLSIPYGVKTIANDAFEGCSNIVDLYWNSDETPYRATYYCQSNLEKVTIGDSVSKIPTYAFWGCKKIKKITIPNSVTDIESNAFNGCIGLTSVVIPSSVLSIGGSAFRGCSGLTSITIPSSVTTIGGDAFEGCVGLTSIAIPISVTSVGMYLLKGCNNLDTLYWNSNSSLSNATNAIKDHLKVAIIGDSVKAIGNSAFSGCSELTSISIPENVSYIGDYAFLGCTNLKTVVFVGAPERIGEYSFKNCTSLQAVKIPFGVREIGSEAFNGCSGLTILEIPHSIASISGNAFYNCNNLDTLYWNSNVSPYYVAQGLREHLKFVSFGDSIKTIPSSALYNCSQIMSVKIPESVSKIEDFAFSGCSGLKSVIFGDNISSIERSAFKGCSGLTSVAFPTSLKSIDNDAFKGCAGIKAITMQYGITNIGETAFYGCDNVDTLIWNSNYSPRNVTRYCNETLSCILIGDSVTCIGEAGFLSCKKLSDVVIPDRVIELSDYCFSNCFSLKTVTLPQSITTLGNEVFAGCIGLMTVTIPGSIQTIGLGAFSDCTGLTTAILSEGVRNIGKNAFKGCTDLVSLLLPNSVIEIGNNAFDSCSKLKSVYISEGVSSIGKNAFNGCISLTSFTMPSNVENLGEGVFSNCSNIDTLFWNSCAELSIATVDLQDHLKYVVFGDNIKSIGISAFRNCGLLSSVVVPDGVTSIGYGAFENCVGLKNIIIPNSVTSIGESAFSGCNKLEAFYVPKNVSRIEKNTFMDCAGLKIVSIPEGVTSIGHYAFLNCVGLTCITMPRSVSDIGGSAFEGCCNIDTLFWNTDYSPHDVTRYCNETLRYVFLGDSIQTIGSDAFYNCVNITSIVIPESVSSIKYGAFQGCVGLSSINIPSGVTSLGNYCFEGCSRLSDIVIPDGVSRIGYYTFEGCQGLSSIVIPENVKSIGHNAFSNCSGLKYLYMANVKEIGSEAFKGCNNIDSIYWNSNITPYYVTEYCYNNLKDITIGDSVTTIGYYAFYRCAGLTSLTVPASVTSIDAQYGGAFSGCKNIETLNWNSSVSLENAVRACKDKLKYIVLGGNVNSIEDLAFYGCSHLLSIVIPEGVTTIGDKAFFGCDSLKNITLPSSINYIGKQAFEGCYSIESITIPHGVKNINSRTFWDCKGLKSITLNEGIENIYSRAFEGCMSLEIIRIPNGVSFIDEYTFYRCFGLRSVTIPASVRTIDNSAFITCENIDTLYWNSQCSPYAVTRYSYGVKVVEIGDSVTSIDSQSFKSRSSLRSVKIGQNVESIGASAFRYCRSLSSITIPNKVTYIGDYAFADCSNLNSVISYPQVTPSLGQSIFYNTSVEEASLSVPYSSYKEYSEKWPWNKFGNIYTLEGLYDLTYLVDNNIYSRYTICKDSITVKMAEPLKEGYTFSGWSEIPNTMPSRNVDVMGSFQINKYKLSYYIDDCEYKSFSVAYKDQLPIVVPEKEGYSFTGWSAIPDSMPAKDVAINGSFNINSYKLNYMVDDTVEYKSFDIKYKEKLSAIAAPMDREGYTFSGWSVLPDSMPARDVVVKGSYNTNSYKLKYLVDDTVEYKVFDIRYKEKLSVIADTIAEGYTFSGWSAMPETMPARDVTITGSFNINSYKLRYVVDDTVEYKTFDIKYKEKLSLLADTVTDGYTFSGWSAIPETMPAQDITITGSFNINSYKLRYVVDDTVEYKTFDIKYNEKLSLLADTVAEGYTFSGWSAIPETMPAQDITITGSFNINSYKLIYIVDDTVEYKTFDIKYNEKLSLLADTVAEGYTFSGWSSIPDFMPSHDVYINGSFSINKYLLTIIADSVMLFSDSIVYGTRLADYIDAIVKLGIDLSEWDLYDVVDVISMPAYDVTIIGSLPVPKYIITYIVDGDVYCNDTVDVGSEIVPPVIAKKDGYDFVWNDHPEFMPYYDIVIIGTYITCIHSIGANEQKFEIFTIDGRPLETMQPGMNIIRYSNGTTRKVVIE